MFSLFIYEVINKFNIDSWTEIKESVEVRENVVLEIPKFKIEYGKLIFYKYIDKEGDLYEYDTYNLFVARELDFNELKLSNS